MKNLSVIILLFGIIACNSNREVHKADNEADLQHINSTLDNWHKAAAKTDFEKYFYPLTDDAVFMGTDATEHWTKDEFMVWSKPYFDKGKAWSFIPLQRHIYFDASGNLAWFDELLDTQMKICRGSGVMVRKGTDWKIQQYVLSVTVPNEVISDVIKTKEELENRLIEKLSTK